MPECSSSPAMLSAPITPTVHAEMATNLPFWRWSVRKPILRVRPRLSRPRVSLLTTNSMFGRTALLLLAPAILPAQAPRITQQGDPTVKSDTIYQLAVKAADHAEENAVFLLDDGVVRLEADGRGTQTFRQVVQILKQPSVDHYNEFSWG